MHFFNVCCSFMYHVILLSPSLSRLFSNNKPRIKLLLIGLDNAGKTTTVMRLLGRKYWFCMHLHPFLQSFFQAIMRLTSLFQGPAEDIVPTIGFSSIEMKQINKFAVEIYDLGGGAKIRDIWKNYFSLVHGIIYVVDSADEGRIPEIKSNLQDVIQHERISKKPILV